MLKISTYTSFRHLLKQHTEIVCRFDRSFFPYGGLKRAKIYTYLLGIQYL